MEERPMPPPSAATAPVCFSCGADLSKGAGRYLLECGPVCVACHDAGYRGPPEKKADRPG